MGKLLVLTCKKEEEEMVLWQVRGSVCAAFESCTRSLLKIAVSPAVHFFFFFFFRRSKPDLLSGLNAEEKNKCGNMVEKKLLEEEENYGLKSEVSFLGREISYLR